MADEIRELQGDVRARRTVRKLTGCCKNFAFYSE